MSNQQTRYTILLDPPTVATLNDLQARFSLATRAAVFDLALVVLDWVAKQEDDGYEVGREKDANFQPLLLPVKRRPALPARPHEGGAKDKQSGHVATSDAQPQLA
jgi:hypothetical protein